MQGNFREGYELNVEAETIFRERCTGATWEFDTACFMSLWSAFYRGDVLDLARRLPVHMRESHSRGNRYALTNLRTTFAPFLRLMADDVDGSIREAEDAISTWSRSGFHIQHLNSWFSSVQAELYRGGGGARAALESRWAAYDESILPRVQQIRVRANHFRAAVLLAEGGADAAVEREARRLDGERVGWARALAQLVRAGVAARARRAGARADLERAVAQLETADLNLYAAAGRLQLGGDEAQRAERWMSEQHILQPRRMAAMLAPGLCA
jgi:hypothetical protein